MPKPPNPPTDVQLDEIIKLLQRILDYLENFKECLPQTRQSPYVPCPHYPHEPT